MDFTDKLGRRERQVLEAVYRRGSASVNDVLAELPEARLKIGRRSETHTPGGTVDDALIDLKDEWVETVPLKPGLYRLRLLSWGVFGTGKPEPASGWIPIEVK